VSAAQFILVRHGETEWNREGRIQGHLDSALNPQGIAQAGLLAARLAAESFEVLISSDLGRALRTAELIAVRTGHGMIVDARLRERHYGVFQGMTHHEAESAYPDAYAKYRDEDIAHAIAGGESTQACFARNLACLEELAARFSGQRVVVVAHGGVLEGLYRHVMHLPHIGARAFTIVNASLNWFTHRNGQWHLDRWGDVEHLGPGRPLADM
jgi:2,3-bisphosphoglycerate-dependent phosphoglycerate mutase